MTTVARRDDPTQRMTEKISIMTVSAIKVTPMMTTTGRLMLMIRTLEIHCDVQTSIKTPVMTV